MAVGNTLGTEVTASWDPALLGELGTTWASMTTCTTTARSDDRRRRRDRGAGDVIAYTRPRSATSPPTRRRQPRGATRRMTCPTDRRGWPARLASASWSRGGGIAVVVGRASGTGRMDKEIGGVVAHRDRFDDLVVPRVARRVLGVGVRCSTSPPPHFVADPLIRLDGDAAQVDTCIAHHVRTRATPSCALRCVDRFERRDGRWRIAKRVWNVRLDLPSRSKGRDVRVRRDFTVGHSDRDDIRIGGSDRLRTARRISAPRGRARGARSAVHDLRLEALELGVVDGAAGLEGRPAWRVRRRYWCRSRPRRTWASNMVGRLASCCACSCILWPRAIRYTKTPR